MTALHLAATPRTTLWGTLPCESDAPVLTVDPGQQVTIDTVSHEGILEDQGRDPVAFFGKHGVAEANVLADAIDVAAHSEHDPSGGPHVVTGPIAVRGARPGDRLAVRIDALRPRAAYGVISSRHGIVPTGLDADLDVAVERCAANAVELLTTAFGMDPELAYAYLSAATDFDISQVVDLVKGVHARIRLADFPRREGWPW